MRNQDWRDWLKAALQQELYIANNYISNEPTDYYNTCVPSLRTMTNNLPSTAEDNTNKARALAESFFPLLLTTSHVPQNVDYSQLLKGIHFFSRVWIHQVICTPSPYKSPGPNQISNVVLIKCCNVLIDHLFFILRAVFEHDVYHPWWLESTTLVLKKIGKPAYDVAKAYHPIGLIDTILKVLSMLCALTPFLPSHKA